MQNYSVFAMDEVHFTFENTTMLKGKQYVIYHANRYQKILKICIIFIKCRSKIKKRYHVGRKKICQKNHWRNCLSELNISQTLMSLQLTASLKVYVSQSKQSRKIYNHKCIEEIEYDLQSL